MGVGSRSSVVVVDGGCICLLWLWFRRRICRARRPQRRRVRRRPHRVGVSQCPCVPVCRCPSGPVVSLCLCSGFCMSRLHACRVSGVVVRDPHPQHLKLPRKKSQAISMSSTQGTQHFPTSVSSANEAESRSQAIQAKSGSRSS